MIKQLLRNAGEQLGWQGMYGIVLLVLASAFHLFALEPLQEQTLFMRSRIDAARSKDAIQGRTPSPIGRQEQLGVFFDSLPDGKDVTDALAAIYSIAEACGLQFKEATYHLEDRDRPRVEYVVNFPVSGEYAKIRLFVFRILATYPAIALDQIDFQRDRVGDTTLKANVRLTMFLKPFK